MTYPNPLAQKLGLIRLARLHAKYCIRGLTWEIVLLVGTKEGSQLPVFHLETLNLILAPTEDLGGGRGTPSVCLPGGTLPPIQYNPDSNDITSEFEVNIDFPMARQTHKRALDPNSDTPGPTAIATKARLYRQFLSKLEPRPFGHQNLECKLNIDVPDEIIERLGAIPTIDLSTLFPLIWYYFAPRKELCIQPVFISADGATPPTGSDFYPLLARANELWAKCCIQFTSKCPRYVDKQEYRISTQTEATAFKDEVNVADAIEVFVVERLDPEETWGGGATFASGTATAKIVTGDNQLPLNQNHLAHELGHVLGLGHPGNAGSLVDACAGSLMEPSGFFADNPEFQCEHNCISASNPLLTIVPYQWCIMRDRPDNELF